MTTMSPAIDFDLGVRLCASLDGMAAEVRADRQRREQLAADVDYIPGLMFAATALPFAQAEQAGPKRGYVWAVAAMRVSNLGASTDFVQVFRGKVTAAAVTTANSAFPPLNTFSAASATPFWCAPWHPGRTGLVLKPGDGVVFGGTVTGIGASAPLVISMDVIQLTEAKLPYFLL